MSDQAKVEVKKYRKPTCPYIGRGPSTEKLYKLEEKSHEVFKKCAQELGKVLGLEDFWREILPEAMFSFLDGWDRSAGIIAAIAFLERQGYDVKANEPIGTRVPL